MYKLLKQMMFSKLEMIITDIRGIFEYQKRLLQTKVCTHEIELELDLNYKLIFDKEITEATINQCISNLMVFLKKYAPIQLQTFSH